MGKTRETRWWTRAQDDDELSELATNKDVEHIPKKFDQEVPRHAVLASKELKAITKLGCYMLDA